MEISRVLFDRVDNLGCFNGATAGTAVEMEVLRQTGRQSHALQWCHGGNRRGDALTKQIDGLKLQRFNGATAGTAVEIPAGGRGVCVVEVCFNGATAGTAVEIEVLTTACGGMSELQWCHGGNRRGDSMVNILVLQWCRVSRCVAGLVSESLATRGMPGSRAPYALT